MRRAAVIIGICVVLAGCSSGGSGGLRTSETQPTDTATPTTESSYLRDTRDNLARQIYLDAVQTFDATTPAEKLNCYATTIAKVLPAGAIRQWDEEQAIPFGDSHSRQALHDAQGYALHRCHLP